MQWKRQIKSYSYYENSFDLEDPLKGSGASQGVHRTLRITVVDRLQQNFSKESNTSHLVRVTIIS